MDAYWPTKCPGRPLPDIVWYAAHACVADMTFTLPYGHCRWLLWEGVARGGVPASWGAACSLTAAAVAVST